MLNSNTNERELAFVGRVTEVTEIPGADRVELVHVNGWRCLVPKKQFSVGSLGVLFEIDSKLPEDNPAFAFMSKRNFKVKAQKFFKGTVISDALFMGFEDLGWDENAHAEGDFVTKELNITYADAEDNVRKAKSNPNAKYNSMVARHPKLAKNKFTRWLLKREWGKKVLFFFFGKNKDKRDWPQFVTKTDEERVQNLGPLYNEYRAEKWIATEKIDGSSATFAMKRGKKKNEFFVCSRNVVMTSPDRKNFYSDTIGNIYWEMALKYNIEKVLNTLLSKHPNWEWVYIQGEIFGKRVQKREYGLEGRDLRVFNFVTSEDGRWNSLEGKTILNDFNIEWVPIVATDFVLPENTDTLLDFATNNSAIDGKDREGIVFRSLDGKRSFKAVSPEFLAKWHG